jgi:iron complex outermembrane receptor protein
VRTPSPIERDGYIAAFGVPAELPGDPDTLFAFVPGPEFDSERVYAYELGYRAQLTDDLAVDIATYYNDFDRLGTEELGADVPIDATTVLAPFVAENKGSGIGRGVEVSAEWIASQDWELEAGYTFTNLLTRIDDSSNDFLFSEVGRAPPKDILHVRSHHELTSEWEADLLVYYTSELRTADIPAAVRTDVRFGWSPSPATEIAFGLRNLGHVGDAETSGGNEIEPEGYIRGSFRF